MFLVILFLFSSNIFKYEKYLFVERISWFTRLLLLLTAGDFGVHCGGFHVTGWDESPKVTC